MAIQRFDPLRDLMVLHDRINRLFEESIARSGGLRSAEGGPAAWTPPLDLHEEPGRFVLRADVPGVPGSSIRLEVAGGDLTVRGEKASSDPAVAKDAFLRMERPSGAFSLRLTVPESVERTQIQASCKDGVLEVVLPKKKDDGAAARHSIPVQ